MKNLTIDVAGRTLPISGADVSRFWLKVDKGAADGCWIWVASGSPKGYGLFSVGGRLAPAHRVSWVMAGESLDSGKDLDHLCHTRNCVNPAHLRQVSHAANAANRSGPAATNTSGMRGVSWRADKQKWAAQVMFRQRKHHAGYFDTRDAAELAAISKRVELGMANAADHARLAEIEQRGL